MQFLEFDFLFNIYRTIKREQKQCPACDKIVFNVLGHLRPGIYKWSDDSAKDAVNHFGIQKRQEKMEMKINGNPKNVAIVTLFCKGLGVIY